MVFETLFQARDYIVEQVYAIWRTGSEHEELMYKLCNEFNVEPYLVREHLTEVIRHNYLNSKL